MSTEVVTDADYEALASFRHVLRRFLRYSTEAAAELGLESQQYQALLAIRGRGRRQSMTIGELAEEMQIRPNSAVGMARRLENRGLVMRQRDHADRRRVFVTLTPAGLAILERLAAAHKMELKKAVPAFDILVRHLEATAATGPSA